MHAPITCPKCGTHHPAGAYACGCGHTFPVTTPVAPDQPPSKAKEAATPTERPITIERPFDIGKPLATTYPVSQVCPKCGSSEYKAVRPKTMVAFADDRVCQACSTRYTPPTPLWARLIFAAFGLAAVATGAVLSYAIFQGKTQGGLFGLLGPVVAAVAGLGCLYKAVTK
jgi:hypothetical protein